MNADVPDALRGTNQCLPSNARCTAAPQNLLERPLFVTIFAGDGHPQGQNPRRRTVWRWCIADNHCMHRSGGRTLSSLLARLIPPPR